MRTEAVIVAEIAPARLPQCLGGMELIDVNKLRFKAPEPSFNQNFVCPAGFFIHALSDVQAFQQLRVLVAGETGFLGRN